MITILHGLDNISSRNFLNTLITPGVIRYNPESIDTEELIQLSQGGGLFDEEKTIIIENFFSKKNKNQKELTDFLNNSKNLNLIIWQDRELTKNEQSSLKTAKIQEFKLSKFLFTFLDQIKPNNKLNIKNFHEALETTPTELLFFMITKQIRILLALKTPSKKQIDETKRLADWQKSKLLKQANLFTEGQLKKSFQKLAELDLKIKTGESSLNLTQAIDIWLINL